MRTELNFMIDENTKSDKKTSKLSWMLFVIVVLLGIVVVQMYL